MTQNETRIQKMNNIFIWSPMTSHVGTIKASTGMAKAFKNFGKANVYLINVFGEFNSFEKDKNYKLLNIFS